MLLAGYVPKTAASVFSPSAGCSGSGVSAVGNDSARTGGSGELPPALGAPHLSLFCVQSSICWVPFSSFWLISAAS